MFKIVHETTVKHQTTTAFQWHNGSFVIRSAKQGVKSGPVELRSIGTFSCHMATLPVKGLMTLAFPVLFSQQDRYLSLSRSFSQSLTISSCRCCGIQKINATFKNDSAGSFITFILSVKETRYALSEGIPLHGGHISSSDKAYFISPTRNQKLQSSMKDVCDYDRTQANIPIHIPQNKRPIKRALLPLPLAFHGCVITMGCLQRISIYPSMQTLSEPWSRDLFRSYHRHRIFSLIQHTSAVWPQLCA